MPMKEAFQMQHILHLKYFWEIKGIAKTISVYKAVLLDYIWQKLNHSYI